MRRARANDHWRHVCDVTRHRPWKTVSLTFNNVLGLGNVTLPLHHALTVVCGANGAGKSTVLSIAELLFDNENSSERSKTRHDNCVVTAELEHTDGANSATKTFQLSNGNHQLADTPINVHRLDPGAEWFRIKDLVRADQNWAEYLQQFEPKTLEAADLEMLSFLTHKDYSACEVFEIEGYAGESAIPYARVTANGESYGFEEMGAGEGSLFLMWWSFDRFNAPGVILLEEPETHITGHSQRALMDYLAKKCEREMVCIATTHSTEIISYVPHECLRLLVRQGGQVAVVKSPSYPMLNTILGVGEKVKLIVVVEDRCAREMIKELLRVLRSDICNVTTVVDVGSNNVVIANAQNYPKIACPQLLCVLDGNERDTELPEGLSHPVEYLPDNFAPEQFLRNGCNGRVQELAQALGIGEEEITIALAAAEGVNHHQWPFDLMKALNVSYETMVGALVRASITHAATQQLCQQFVDMIAEQLPDE